MPARCMLLSDDASSDASSDISLLPSALLTFSDALEILILFFSSSGFLSSDLHDENASNAADESITESIFIN